MPSEHVNREDVQARLERLRNEYGSFPLVEEEEVRPPEAFEGLLEDARECYTGGAYAWTTRAPEDIPPLSESMPDDVGETEPQVLLILGRGADEPHWGTPGGGREDGETSEEAVRREVREETGVVVDVGAPYLASHGRIRPDEDRDVCVHLLYCFFEATYEDCSIDVQESEVRGAAWFQNPPGGLHPSVQYRAVRQWPDYEPDEPWWEDDQFAVEPP